MFSVCKFREVIAVAVEEIENPAKVVTQAIVSGTIMCICIYILTNVAYYAVMTKEEVLTVSAVAVVCVFSETISFVFRIQVIFSILIIH